MIENVAENALITQAEALSKRYSVNTGLPAGFEDHGIPAVIFVSDGNFHVGTINFDGKWSDHHSGEFIADVTHWVYREGFLDNSSGGARFYGQRAASRGHR
jgi:hypothetical protein